MRSLTEMGLNKFLDEELEELEQQRLLQQQLIASQQDIELDDDDLYPRSRTPVLDDSPNCRGHSGIGPTPTGGLLGDFPRGEHRFI